MILYHIMASGVEKDGQMLFLHEKKSGGAGPQSVVLVGMKPKDIN